MRYIILVLVLVCFTRISFGAVIQQDDKTVILDLMGFHQQGDQYYSKEKKDTVSIRFAPEDLNNDGQDEVFALIDGTYWGGGAGVKLHLFVKDENGTWQPNLGFPGDYEILETFSNGFRDIAITGPWTCNPVWHWNGDSYRIGKSCDNKGH